MVLSRLSFACKDNVFPSDQSLWREVLSQCAVDCETSVLCLSSAFQTEPVDSEMSRQRMLLLAGNRFAKNIAKSR